MQSFLLVDILFFPQYPRISKRNATAMMDTNPNFFQILTDKDPLCLDIMNIDVVRSQSISIWRINDIALDCVFAYFQMRPEATTFCCALLLS